VSGYCTIIIDTNMEYRKCGNTGFSLSVIGTGCWSFGGGDYWGSHNQADVNTVVHAAIDAGINYFDTAEAYNDGRSELSLGEAIREIQRDKIIIGSKVSPSHCYAGLLEQHCEASLKRLQTDYIDIYMIHWPVHAHSIKHFTNDQAVIAHPPSKEEMFTALQALMKAGKIRTIGISNYSRQRMQADIPADITASINELPYNLLCRAIEWETLPYCASQHTGVIGYMTLLQGILTNRFGSLSDVPEWQRRTRHFDAAATPLSRHGGKGFEQQTTEALHRIREIAGDYGTTIADIATQWVIANPAITSALIGARTLEKLNENIRAASASLPGEIKLALDEVTTPLKELMGNHFDYYESPENDRTV
jgi:myo-inositol catabolism protein IolS